MTNRFIQTLIVALLPVFFQVSAEELVALVPFTSENSVSALEQRLSDEEQQLISLEKELVERQQEKTIILQRQKEVSTELKAAKNARTRAKGQLDRQFAAVLQDPTIDIIAAQQTYQQAFQLLMDKELELNTVSGELIQQAKVISENAKNNLNVKVDIKKLEEQIKVARIKRVQKELSYSDTVGVAHKVTCNLQMTLAECAEQSKIVTMQKAVRAFRSNLLKGLTERELAKLQADNVSLNIHVVNSQILNSGFEETTNFLTRVQAEMRSHPSKIAPCQLLELEEKYCVEPKSRIVAIKAPDRNYSGPKKWLSVTIRSNVYDDGVVIDGVDYGKTPIDIMLPSGMHRFEIRKEGYQPYIRELEVDQDQTIWTELFKQKTSNGWQTTAMNKQIEN